MLGHTGNISRSVLLKSGFEYEKWEKIEKKVT